MLRRKKEKAEVKSELRFYALQIGDVKPKGWLKDQMDAFVSNFISETNSSWSKVNNTLWTGGKGDYGYEGLSYVNGVLKLAYQTDNVDLKRRFKPWIDGIMATGKPNGDFGKEEDGDWLYKIYAIRLIATYYELTTDKTAYEFIFKFLKYQYNEIDLMPFSINAMASLYVEIGLLNTLFDITGKEFFLEMKQKLARYGYDFRSYFTSLPYTSETQKYLSKRTAYFKANQIKKQQTVEDLAKVEKTLSENRDKKVQKYVLSHGRVVGGNLSIMMEMAKHTNDDERELTKNFVKTLYQNHGLVNGCFSSDDHLDGRDADVGYSLSTAILTLKSMLDLERLSADSYYTNYADDIFYNAVLGGISEDYSKVQTVASCNQIGLKEYYSYKAKDNCFAKKVGDELTSVVSDAFSEFTDSLAYLTDDGFAFCHYAPCVISSEYDGVSVEIEEETNYPFDSNVTLKINELSDNKEMTFRLIVPKYTTISVLVNGNEVAKGVNGFVNIKKVFQRGDVITVKVNNSLRAVFNDDGSMSFRMGGLILCNPISSNLITDKKGLDSAECREDYRKAPIIRDKRLEIKEIRKSLSKYPFSMKNPGVKVKLKADYVTNWSKDVLAYAKLPRTAKFSGNEDEITLVPYASTINRISQFPYKVVETKSK